MSDNTPDAPQEPAPAAYVPPPAPTPDVLADYQHPVGSAYDPMPMTGQQDTSSNWMGIISLITGIIAMPLFAVIFGILGLSAVKKGTANNKGMSIAGIVLAGVWVLAGIVFFASIALFAANAPTISNSASSSEASVGACFVSNLEPNAELAPVDPRFGDCTDSTNAQVYYITTFTGTSGPDDATFSDDLFAVCTATDAVANVDVELSEAYFVEYFLPDAGDWDESDRTVVCSLSKEAGPVHEDLVTE